MFTSAEIYAAVCDMYLYGLYGSADTRKEILANSVKKLLSNKTISLSWLFFHKERFDNLVY